MIKKLTKLSFKKSYIYIGKSLHILFRQEQYVGRKPD